MPFAFLGVFALRLAAIDIGTNSVRLLVAEVQDGRIKPIIRKLITTRLGEGLVLRRALPENGKEKTAHAVLTLQKTAVEHDAGTIQLFGTSALREARDGRRFARELSCTTGLCVRILSAEEEAMLSYTGVKETLLMESGTVVFDLGGGSCELIWPEGDRTRIESLKIGAVYLFEKFAHHDPPTEEEMDSAREHIRGLVGRFHLHGRPVVGLGGTVTNLAALAMGMTEYDAKRVHGYRLTRETVLHLLDKMMRVPLAERLLLPGIQADRADIMPVGTVVVNEILQVCQAAHLTVSEGDILVGCIYSLLHQH